MRILVSNDDGIFAAGIPPLVGALERLGEVWVVAPASEQSASSHSLTMHEPLRIQRIRDRWFSVSGTPADCVYMAVNHLLPARPAVVVSGINRGGNLSEDTHYSGTVAAAREAVLVGIRGVAVSLHVPWGAPSQPGYRWEAAAALASRVVADVVGHPIETCRLFNLNVPNLPLAELKGIKLCRLGHRHYEVAVEDRLDLRGRHYYWIGGDHAHFDDRPDTDGPTVESGWASLTPMRVDMTADAALPDMATWGCVDAPS